MIHDDDSDVARALKGIAPARPPVSADLLAGARRKRARTRATVTAVAGVGALAVLAGVALPAMLFSGGPSGQSEVADQRPAVQSPHSRTEETAEASRPENATPPTQAATQAEMTADLSAVAAATERLGWEAILGAGTGNQVVSPSSLALALALAAEGARGTSLTSIDAALGLDGDARSEGFGALRRSLSAYETPAADVDLDTPPSTPQIHLANRALAIDAAPEAAFMERAERYLGAPTESTTRTDAKADLDSWVRENTGGLIDKSAVTVTPDTSVVLQDALLFSAAWQTPFGNQVSIPFAGAGEVDGVNEVLTVPFAETDRWSAVRLPYGGPFAADVILPKAGIDALTADDLAAANTALGTAEAQRVSVTMPVVDLASTVDLGAALPGIDLSDLGGIVPGGSAPTWMQQTVLKVTAQGTVGAAVTEIPVAGSAPNEDKPLTFLVDRPYVMRVLDTGTSVPLLMASVVTPGE